jgi:hypothetical protein
MARDAVMIDGPFFTSSSLRGSSIHLGHTSTPCPDRRQAGCCSNFVRNFVHGSSDEGYVSPSCTSMDLIPRKLNSMMSLQSFAIPTFMPIGSAWIFVRSMYRIQFCLGCRGILGDPHDILRLPMLTERKQWTSPRDRDQMEVICVCAKHFVRETYFETSLP